MRCSLCGYEFDETQLVCHSSCALNKHCAIICCPSCGYQVPDESRSRLSRALRRALGQDRKPVPAERPATCPLSALHAGESGTVTDVRCASLARLEKLSVLGVLPGTRITVEQRQPVFVLRVGFTDLSIERNVADEILVEPAF